MAMNLSSKPKKKIILNITSLIDVLFILIIFFVVSSTFLEQPAIKLNLPEASTSEAYAVQKVVLYIDQEENMFLNDKPVKEETVAESVEQLISAQTDKSLVLKADDKVTHGLVIRIMDALRKKGIYKIVVSTTKP
jgi:biopolymer transport protein ExbD